jgi:hypothetical protein
MGLGKTQGRKMREMQKTAEPPPLGKMDNLLLLIFLGILREMNVRD